MVRQIAAVISFVLFPILLFTVIAFGITFFAQKIEGPAEELMISPQQQPITCGNGVCEKVERQNALCAADC